MNSINEDELAMAALHKHLAHVHMHYGASFILSPLADIMMTSLNSLDELTLTDKLRFIKSIVQEFDGLLIDEI